MSTAVLNPSAGRTVEMEYATFYVGDILLGVDLQQMEEINRQLELTPVPQSPDFVRGVVNLRGEVVTVVDLRKILGLEATEIASDSRNLIVRFRGEQVGLLIDRVADVVRVKAADVEPPPANLNGLAGRFFQGVYKLESALLVILDVNAVLSPEGTGS